MSQASKRSSLPRFTLAAFFSAPKPCEDALADLGIAYNKLADQVEEAWAENERLDTALTRAMQIIADLQQESGSATDSESPSPLEMRNALEWIAAQQQKTLAMIERNGFVFDDIGREPGNWKHLAFSIYADLCEIDTIAHAALGVPLRAERSPNAERTQIQSSEQNTVGGGQVGC